MAGMERVQHQDPGDPNAVLHRLFQLTEELESLANQLNPDYEAQLEDGAYGTLAPTDFGNQLRTSVTFGAERVREQLTGESRIGFPFPGDDMMTKYTLTGIVTHVLPVFDGFPEHVRKSVLDLGVYEETLEDESTEYAVSFEQEITVTSDGGFERKIAHRYLIDDFCVLADIDQIDPDDLEDSEVTVELDESAQEPLPAGQPVNIAELSAIFGVEEMAELAKVSNNIVAQHLGSTICQQMTQMVSDLDHLSRMQELEMASGMAAQIPIPLTPHADAI